MQSPIQVGSSHRAWWFLTLAAVTAGLLIGGGLLSLARGWGPESEMILIAGTVGALATGLAAVAITARKASVQVGPHGFVFRDRHGEREFTDDQVICASLHSTPVFTDGTLKATNRTFDLWVEGESGPERLNLINRIPIESLDPLEPLIERILRLLQDAAAACHAEGQPFEGEDWTLYANELVVTRKRTSAAVSIDELSAVDVFENDICLWKHGEDQPAVRIPVQSANAHVLLRLLRDRVPPQAPNDVPQSGENLGRILFERNPTSAVILAAWGIPLAGIPILVVSILAALNQQQMWILWTGGIISLGFGLIWWIPLKQCVWFRCHEHGISRRWLRWEKRVRYADVGSFAYGAVRQEFKGIYTGTTFTLTFSFPTEGKWERLTYVRTLRNADDELDRLRDRVSEVIAARMADEFAAGKVVSWTDGLRFLSEGLEYRASGFLGRKAPVMVFYGQITNVDVSKGIFRVWIAGRKKSIVKENASEANFFPGYLHLTRLLASPPAELASTG